MSKLSKLLRAPGAFLRDGVLRRFPIEFRDNIELVRSADARPILDPLPVTFPIDVVYTWVDGDDDAWQALRREHVDDGRPRRPDEDTAGRSRFEDHEELRFSLRSLEAFAPWVRHIWIVTADQRPAWLRDSARLTVVSHRDIIPAQYLPTFNSHVIEAHLHHIPGLAEHYVYFNDDMMLARPLQPGDLFLSSGAARISLSGRRIPVGSPTTADTPMDCASKNVRQILNDAYGIDIHKQILHGFYTQRRATALQCEAMSRERWTDFRSNRFRAMDDLNLATLMQPYVGFMEGRSVFSLASCMYVNIHAPSTASAYAAMFELRGTGACPDGICVNQIEVSIPDAERRDRDRALQTFLNAYFPAPSVFEA